MAEIIKSKTLNTILRLKYDTLAAWKAAEEYVPMKGEVCIVAVPTDAQQVASEPAILFKVGDGTGVVFKKEGSDKVELPWASGLAADVHAWAKESSLTVTKNGTGNVVASISWDATLNNGKGGIKYETAAVATAEGLDQIQKDLAALTNTVNGMYTNTQIDEAIAAALDGAKDYTDTKDSAMNTRVKALEDKFGEGEGNVESQIEAAVNVEKERAMAAEKANADAIVAIKDGTTIDSFADVESALAGKQAAGDYATKTEAKAYADAKDTAIKAAQDKADANETEIANVKATAEAAYVLPEGGIESDLSEGVKASLAKANSALQASDIVDLATKQEVTDAKEAAITAAKTELDGITLAIEDYNDVESIVIKDSKGVVIADVSAATFVKDGMLTDAQYNTDTNKIILTWNTDSGKTTTEVDLNDLVDTYTGGNGITVATNGEISIDDDVVVTHNDLNDTVNTLVGTVDDTADTASITGAKKYTDAQITAEATARNTAISEAVADLDSSVTATAEADNQVSVLTGITQEDGKLTNKTEVKLAAIAKTGNVNDLVQTNGEVLVLFGGNAAGWTE